MSTTTRPRRWPLGTYAALRLAQRWPSAYSRGFTIGYNARPLRTLTVADARSHAARHHDNGRMARAALWEGIADGLHRAKVVTR